MWSKTHKDVIVKSSDALISQNFGLTSDQFDAMVTDLKNGNELLFEKIFLSHFQFCLKYLTANFHVDYELAYDTTMDALIDFRQKLILGKLSYGNLKYLFTKMATQLLIKKQNKESQLISLISEPDENLEDTEQRLVALDKAWGELSEEEKIILEHYYYLDLPLNQLADKFNKTDIAIRKQKQRAIEKLKHSFFNIFKYES